jgi:hypothetical protein
MEGFDCTKVRQQGSVCDTADKKVQNELAEHIAFITAVLTLQKVKLIATGELLTSSKDETIGKLMDSMSSCWNLDLVHREPVAYTKIGLTLLDLV